MTIERFQVHPKLRDPLTPFRLRDQRVGLDNQKKKHKMAKNVLKSWSPLSFCSKIFWFSEFVWPTLYTWRPKAKFFRSFWGIPEADLVAMICPDFWVWTKQKVFKQTRMTQFFVFFPDLFLCEDDQGVGQLPKKAEPKPLFLLPQIRKSGVISDSFYLHRIQKQTATNPFSATPKRKGTWLNDMSDREHQLKAMSLTSISNAVFLLLYEHLFFKIMARSCCLKWLEKVKQKFLKSPIFWWCKMVMAQFIPWDRIRTKSPTVDLQIQSHGESGKPYGICYQQITTFEVDTTSGCRNFLPTSLKVTKKDAQRRRKQGEKKNHLSHEKTRPETFHGILVV